MTEAERDTHRERCFEELSEAPSSNEARVLPAPQFLAQWLGESQGVSYQGKQLLSPRMQKALRNAAGHTYKAVRSPANGLLPTPVSVADPHSRRFPELPLLGSSTVLCICFQEPLPWATGTWSEYAPNQVTYPVPLSKDSLGELPPIFPA